MAEKKCFTVPFDKFLDAKDPATKLRVCSYTGEEPEILGIIPNSREIDFSVKVDPDQEGPEAELFVWAVRADHEKPTQAGEKICEIVHTWERFNFFYAKTDEEIMADREAKQEAREAKLAADEAAYEEAREEKLKISRNKVQPPEEDGPSKD
jgi:hypothetical protein